MVLSEALRARIKSGAAPARKKKPIRLRRWVLAATAACLVLVYGVGVAAGAFPGFERLVDWLGEDKRALVQPVMLQSDGDDATDGITMEVLAAVNDGEAAVVFLALNDPSGRIDAHTELYEMDISGAMLSNGGLAYYDETLNSAVYRLAGNGSAMHGGQAVTVEVGSVLLGVEHFDAIDTGITLDELAALLPATQSAAGAAQDNAAPEAAGAGGMANGFSLSYGQDQAGAQALETQLRGGGIPLLQPAGEARILPQADWLSLDASGLAGDYLCLRYSPATEAGRYAYTEWFLTWPGGPQAAWEHVLSSADIPLGEAQQVGWHQLYDARQAVLELPSEVDPAAVTLALTGSRCEGLLEGGWQVSFTLDESPARLAADCEITLGNVTVTRIMLSPIGLTAYSTGEPQPGDPGLYMEAFFADGTSAEVISAYSAHSYADDTAIQRYDFARPVRVEDIARVEVNGQVVQLVPV